MIPFSTLKLSADVGVRACNSYRNEEQYDSVVVFDGYLEVPWICVRQIFITGTQSSPHGQWILAQKYKFVDNSNPLDYTTGAPHLRLEEEEEGDNPFVVLPIIAIQQTVHIISDKRSPGACWVNWWLTYGAYSYPEQHRAAIQKLYKWRE